MDRDLDIPQTLSEAARAGRLIPFVGAGVSMAVRGRDGGRLFPSWAELLKRAAGRLEAEGKPPEADRVTTESDAGKYLEAARLAREGLGGNWAPFLQGALGVELAQVEPGSLELAKAVWELGSPLIVTTNYDKVLDWACPRSADLQRWNIEAPAGQVEALRGGLTRPTLWHLHGLLDHVHEVILTPDGYEALYPSPGVEGRYRAALAALKGLLASHTFLFIGFSFEDDALHRQVQWLQETFGGQAGPHYVLVRAAERERMAERTKGLGVEVVPFADFGAPLVERVRAVAGLTPSPSHRVSVFLSCSPEVPEDRELAGRLAEALAREGHDVFNDAARRWGEQAPAEIAERIARADLLVALLSEGSVHSEYMREAVRRAPRLVGLRVGYEGALPYGLSGIVPEWRTWRLGEELAPVVEALLDVARGGAAAPEAGAPDRSHPQGRARSHAGEVERPEPAVDPRGATPGTALKVSDHYYVERPQDAEARALAHRVGETVVIRAPQQFGKSSLLRRYLAACREAGKRVALVDLGLLAEQALADYPAFLTRLAEQVLGKLGLEATSEPAPAIRNQPDMMGFMERRVLRAVREPLVLALEGVDRVLGQPYQSGFFSMLRAWHEQRVDDDSWARLDLALTIPAELILLVSDPSVSPFQVGAPVVLEPFSEEECRALNLRHPRVLPEAQVKKLRKLLGGHPYLTRLAYYRMSGPRPMSFEELVRDAHMDVGPFRDHLRALHLKLQRNPERRLLEALRQVIRYGTAPDDPTYWWLHALGLCHKERSGKIVPANELYTRFFGRAS